MIETDKKMKMLNLKLGEKNQMTIHDFCWFWKCFNSLVPKNKEKQNPEESYTINYENHVGYNYCYKLECVDDHFSWHISSYLGQEAVHKFTYNTVKEPKYCGRVMKKHFNKELVCQLKKVLKTLTDLPNAGFMITL